MKIWKICLVAVLVITGIYWTGTVWSQDDSRPMPPAPRGNPPPRPALMSPDIDADAAHRIIMAAMQKAEDINCKMDIAIVDAGGNLKAFIRMDGAWLGSIDIAIKKAKTARYFDMPTGEIGKLSQPGGPLYNIEHSNNGLITFPGGLPIKNRRGEIVGAIGVSGSTVDNDAICAEAGAKAYSSEMAPPMRRMPERRE